MRNTLISLIVFGFVGTAFAEVTVICNSGVEIKSAEVKEVYTGEKASIGGTKLVLSDNKAVIGDFSSKVLGMDAAKYGAMWAKKSFRDGTPAPKSKGSDNEVVDFVKSTPGGVGYISGAKPAGVNEVGKF